jgi:hypothetical protein
MTLITKRWIWLLCTALIAIGSVAMGAAIGITWTKSEVIPVVLVKPGISGFEPVEGSSIGNTWRKSEVKPVVLVKQGIGGFEPREGTSIGNTWGKEDILPIMLVEPSTRGFIPLRLLSTGGASTGDTSPIPPLQTKPHIDEREGVPASQSIIESQVNGDFEGWDGETILKLANGQIWQQSEYYYHYHYAFMPKVLIFKSDGGFKMKVEGVEKAVGVKRLK